MSTNIDSSELILKTYKEITLKLEKPYYVLEGIPAQNGSNKILYSSPNLKELIGLTQYELSSSPHLFFDSIHPDFLTKYYESNKRLLLGTKKEKRVYMVKNKETGEFIPIEEIASIRLNKTKNYYEIYCSLSSINNVIDTNAVSDPLWVGEVLANKCNLTTADKNRLLDTASHFIASLSKNFGMNGCRFYAYNEKIKELAVLADLQSKTPQQAFEENAQIKVKSIFPKYSEGNIIYKYLLSKEFKIIEDKKEILEILKAHTDNIILKTLAGTAVRIYNMKTFGICPVVNVSGNIVGLITFSSSNNYSDAEKMELSDFINTNSTLFCPYLNNINYSQGQG